MKKVSLIIPCYNEEQALPIFAGELDKVRQELRQYDFEVLMENEKDLRGIRLFQVFVIFQKLW